MRPNRNEIGDPCCVVAEFSSNVICGFVPSELGDLAKKMSKQSTEDACSFLVLTSKDSGEWDEMREDC